MSSKLDTWDNYIMSEIGLGTAQLWTVEYLNRHALPKLNLSVELDIASKPTSPR